MNHRQSINIPLSADEVTALVSAAQREYRHPRDQARYILRQALLGDHTQATTTPAAQLQAQPAGPSIGR